MANSVLNVPQRADGAADSVPLLLVDNGDGTYSLGVATSGTAGPVIYLAPAGGGELLPIATYDNEDGTYSLAVSGS